MRSLFVGLLKINQGAAAVFSSRDVGGRNEEGPESIHKYPKPLVISAIEPDFIDHRTFKVKVSQF
jgi:hypothetical protein